MTWRAAPPRNTRVGAWLVQRVAADVSQRREVEDELDRAGVSLPIDARLAWPRPSSARRSVLYVVRGPDGSPAGVFNADAFGAKSLLGYQIVRVARFAPACSIEAASALVQVLAADARIDTRVLRCRLRLVEPSAERRALLVDAFAAAGFRPVAAEGYERTVLLDLRQDRAALLASFSRRARQNIAELDRHDLSIRPVHDPLLGNRMHMLASESFQRTGEAAPDVRWADLIRLAAVNAPLLRITGLYRNGAAAADDLLAFAVAVRHGTNVEYLHGGATRDHGFRRLSLGYGLQWDIIRWAQDLQAQTYDLGGVPPPESPKADRLQGITSFKLAFGSPVVSAAAEFEFVVQPMKDRFARAAARFSGVRHAVGYDL